MSIFAGQRLYCIYIKIFNTEYVIIVLVQASRATSSADTPEDTVKSPNLVNKLLLNVR